MNDYLKKAVESARKRHGDKLCPGVSQKQGLWESHPCLLRGHEKYGGYCRHHDPAALKGKIAAKVEQAIRFIESQGYTVTVKMRKAEQN